MKSANTLLVFFLAISIGPTIQMENEPGTGIPANSWLGRRIALLKRKLNSKDLGHLLIRHHPNNDSQVIITNEQDENGRLGDTRDINALLGILDDMNLGYTVTDVSNGNQNYALVHFLNAPPNPRQPIISNPSEASSSQTPRKRKFN